MGGFQRTIRGRLAAALAAAIALGGCDSSLRRIDEKVDALIAETSASLGPPGENETHDAVVKAALRLVVEAEESGVMREYRLRPSP